MTAQCQLEWTWWQKKWTWWQLAEMAAVSEEIILDCSAMFINTVVATLL